MDDLNAQIDAAAAPEPSSPAEAEATEAPAESSTTSQEQADAGLRTFDAGPTEADLLKEMEALGEELPEKPLDIEIPEDDPGDTVPHEDPNADLDKRLGAIQAEEKRAKQSISAEFERLEAERAKLDNDRGSVDERLSKFESLASRIYSDPAGVLASLGLEEGDFEAAARQLYAMSPKGKEDPRQRQAAAETLRNRETRLELERLRGELTSQKKERDDERAAQTNAQAAKQFLSSATDTINGQTPLAAVMHAKNPAKLSDRLASLTTTIHAETGELPDPSALVVEFEKRYRAELEDAGIDTTLIGQSKQTPPAIAATKKAPTLTNQLSTPTQPHVESLDPDELQADILRQMETLQDPA